MADLDLSGKPWWQSQTLIALLASILAKVAGMVGYSLDANSAVILLMALLSIGADLWAWVGRVRSTKVISKTELLPGMTLK